MKVKSKKLIAFIVTLVIVLGAVGLAISDLGQSPMSYSPKQDGANSKRLIRFPTIDYLFNGLSSNASSEVDDLSLDNSNIEEEKLPLPDEDRSFDEKVVTASEDMVFEDILEYEKENIKELEENIKELEELEKLKELKELEEKINKVNTHIENGRDYYNQGDYQQALEEYNSSLEIIPEVAFLYFERAQVYLALDDLKKALEDITSSIELDSSLAEPEMTFAYGQRGLIYFELEEYEKAIEDWQAYIRLEGEDTETLYRIALAYLQVEAYDEAEVSLSRVLVLDPGYTMAYYQRANVYSLQKKHPEAIMDYDKAIEFQIGLDISYFNRGIAYLSLEKTKEAKADFKEVIKITKNEILIQEAEKILDLLK